MSANSEEEPGDLGLNMRGFLHRWEGFICVILDCIFVLLLFLLFLCFLLFLLFFFSIKAASVEREIGCFQPIEKPAFKALDQSEASEFCEDEFRNCVNLI